MGWGRSYDHVSFDLGELSSCANKYRGYKDELKSIHDNLKTTMNELTSTYWVGKAANKFKSTISDDWLDTVVRYCDMMEQLTKIMDNVVKTYDDLLQQAKSLRVS